MDISLANANSLLKQGEPVIGLAGFALGVAEADIKAAMDQGLWDTWPAEKKLNYILHNVAGRTVGYGYKDDVFGKGPRNTFKLTGFMNKGLAIYVGAEIWKELKLPYYNTAHKLLSPLGLGWSVGGFFDPELSPKEMSSLKNPPTTSPTKGQIAPSQRGFWT